MTEGTILRLTNLAIIEDASPDNVVNLTPVTEGPEGSAVFGATNEHENFEIQAGQIVLDRASPELSVVCLKPDTADITQIESWVDNQTNVYVAGTSLDGGLFFGDAQNTLKAIKLQSNESVTDNDLYAFTVGKETPPGFTDGLYQNGFWIGKNLLGMYKWGDTDADGVADGWSATGFSTTTFTSGQQTLEADTTRRDLERAIWFPFEGQEITFSIDIDSRTGSYATEQIEIEFIDGTGSVISSQVTTFSSTGRKSVTATVPSTTVKVISRLSLQSSSGTVTEVVSDPALKLESESTYSIF